MPTATARCGHGLTAKSNLDVESPDSPDRSTSSATGFRLRLGPNESTAGPRCELSHEVPRHSLPDLDAQISLSPGSVMRCSIAASAAVAVLMAASCTALQLPVARPSRRLRAITMVDAEAGASSAAAGAAAGSSDESSSER